MTRKMIYAPLIALLLSACALSPDYVRPDVATQDQWRGTDEMAADAPAITRDWWRHFNSPELDYLIALSLAENHDLRAGVQRIEQARAGLSIAGAGLLPSASASGGATRTRTDPAQGDVSYRSAVQGGMNISYELDLFGANRAKRDAAHAAWEASLYSQDNLALVTMGDVARGYFTLLNLRERLKVADDNLANSREILRIVTARVREGMESDIELSRQKTSLANAEANRATLLQQIAAAENALAVLTGQTPAAFNVDARTLSGVQIPNIRAEQPSTLLARRPDLRAAEAGLMAANANIGAARAAFFPSLSLGLGGNVSMAGFGDPATSALSLAANIAAPIFQGGRLQGGLDQANARQLELVENYRNSVLTAFREVEDALASVHAARNRETLLADAAAQARKAYQLSKARYDAGTIDFQTLLDTQSSLLSAQDSHAQAKLARLLAAIDLYRALGGGFISS